MALYQDLASIQEARDTVAMAYEAWKTWNRASQAEVDRVCSAMAEAGYQASERLGRLAQEETGYGVAMHKKLKNEFASRLVWQSIREQKTVGVIRHDPDHRLYEIAWPMGVVAGLVPSTNPTSTAFFKALISVKARNAVVFSPHPSARRCIYEAVQVMALAAENAGAPRGLITCLQQVSLPGTQELMSHRHTALILQLAVQPWSKPPIPPASRLMALVRGMCPFMLTVPPILRKPPVILSLPRPSTTPPSAPPSSRWLPTVRWRPSSPG